MVHIPGTRGGKAQKFFATRDYAEFHAEAVKFIKELKENDYKIPSETPRTSKQSKDIEVDPPIISPKSFLSMVEKLINNEIDLELFKRTAEGLIGNKEAEHELAKAILNHKLPAHTSRSELQKDKKPLTYLSAVERYLDFKKDIGVPEHKRRNISDDQIRQIANYLSHFGKSLKEQGLDPELVLMTEIGDAEVGKFHQYLESAEKPDGGVGYSSRAYNKAMAYLRSMFGYVKEELGYDIKNPFEGVNSKYIRDDIQMVEFTEFDALLSVITKDNGWGKKVDRGKVYNENHYRPYLKSAFRLFLETGERRDGVVLLKWNDIEADNWINIPNYKVNRQKKQNILRRAPITNGLADLLFEMGWKTKRGLDEYIVAPEQTNRLTLKNWLTRAFTHYWNLTGVEKEVTLRHLRKTYATLMWSKFGDKAAKITGQTVDTIINHYLSQSNVVGLASRISLRDLESSVKSSKLIVWENAA